MVLVASITIAEAAQFHETEFYKQTFSKLSWGEQNSWKLYFFIEHVKSNIIEDHSNKTCEHRRYVDLDLFKTNFAES